MSRKAVIKMQAIVVIVILFGSMNAAWYLLRPVAGVVSFEVTPPELREMVLGDVNGDGRVDHEDLFVLSVANGSTPGQENWDPDCDLNGDDMIDYEDLLILEANYGKSESDLDGDGIGNVDEVRYGLDPLDPDSDGDGIRDGLEPEWSVDTDGDGFVNALDADSDDDGLLDGVEDENLNGVVSYGETDPLNPDTDDDGLLDGEEDFNFNGIVDAGELIPLVPDSDDDGLKDGEERFWSVDTDDDGLINALDADSDSDGLIDGYETGIGTCPLDPDTDNDGVTDGVEVAKGLNATKPDTDGDCLLDGEEAVEGSYWVEAEDLVFNVTQVVSDWDAVGNKTAVSRQDGWVFNTQPFGAVPNGTYKLYARARAGYPSVSGQTNMSIDVLGGGVNLTDVHPLWYEAKGPVHLHSNSLIDLSDPICTDWDELWPDFGGQYHVDGWNDTGEPFGELSPCDQVEVLDMKMNETSWWHVDEVTVTLNLRLLPEPANYTIYLESEGGFSEYESCLQQPVNTSWCEVYPVFSNRYNVKWWGDGDNSTRLSPSDVVILVDKVTGNWTGWWVEQVATDIVVSLGPVRLLNIYRWFSTPEFAVAECNLTVGVRSVLAKDALLVDRLFLVRMDSINVPLTDPLISDTDGDGLCDGDERVVDSFWWEAEDFAFDENLIYEYANVSNGKYVLFNSSSSVVCKISDAFYTYREGPYIVFVKAANWNISFTYSRLNVTVKVEYEGSTKTLSGNVDVRGPYARGRWSPVYYGGNPSITTFRLNASAKISIELSLVPSNPWVFVDEIALVRMRMDDSMRKRGFQAGDYDLIPRCLNPMDPDTDGDQYRHMPIPGINNSIGYLTDGFEWDIGLNPFDIDTDQDGLWGASYWYAPDNVDPNPFDNDTDSDGIPDFIEDCHPPYGPGGWNPEFGETDWMDADTDDDGILDANENWNYDSREEPWEMNPLLSDTDGDGLLDGYEVGLWFPQGMYRDTDGDGIIWDTSQAAWDYSRSPVGHLRLKPFSNPLDPDTDNDGLPDGWIDRNNNGWMDLGEFEDRDLDGFVDLGDWSWDPYLPGNVPDGLGETYPLLADTDRDGDNDWVEIMEKKTDPLDADWPDLYISPDKVTFDPEQPLVARGQDSVAVTVSADIHNKGTSVPGFLGTIWAWEDIWFRLNVSTEIDGKSISETSLKLYEIGAGETRRLEVSIQLPAGIHNLTVRAETHMKKYVYIVVPIWEEDYDNNIAYLELRVGGYPTAYASASPTSGDSPLDVTFCGWGSDPDGSIEKYEWDWNGNGTYDWNSATTGNTTYTYNVTVGTETYFPVFRVTDDHGFTDARRLPEIVVRGEDRDGDGLTNYYETQIGSDPDDTDTDNDDLDDYCEVVLMRMCGLDPLEQPNEDGDGLKDIEDPDADGDGIEDGKEITYMNTGNLENPESWSGTNPYLYDSDHDGLSDSEDPYPLNPDQDNDGRSDCYEIELYATDPSVPDSDGDRIKDGDDLQPLKKGAALGDYLTDLHAPGLIRFMNQVNATGINETRLFLADQNFTHTVEISKIDVNAMLEYNFGDYKAIDVEYTGIEESRLISETTTELLYGSMEVSLYRINKIYNVTFTNWAWANLSGYFYGMVKTAISPYTNTNQSIVVQFRFSSELDDLTHLTRTGLSKIPVFSYKLYLPQHVTVSDGEIQEVTEEAIYENTVPAIILDENVYQVEMNIPIEHTGQDQLFLYFSPMWLEIGSVPYYGTYARTSPIGRFQIHFGALARRIGLSDTEELIIGYEDFGTLHEEVEPQWAEAKVKTETTTSLQMINGTYYVEDMAITKKVQTRDSLLDVLTTSTASIVGGPAQELDAVLTQKLTEQRYSYLIERFRELSQEALDKAVNTSHVITCIDDEQNQAYSKGSYDGIEIPSAASVCTAGTGAFISIVEAGSFISALAKIPSTYVVVAAKINPVFTAVASGVMAGIHLCNMATAKTPEDQVYHGMHAIKELVIGGALIILSVACPPAALALAIGICVWEAAKLLVPNLERKVDEIKRDIASGLVSFGQWLSDGVTWLGNEFTNAIYEGTEWTLSKAEGAAESVAELFEDACNTIINGAKAEADKPAPAAGPVLVVLGVVILPKWPW